MTYGLPDAGTPVLQGITPIYIPPAVSTQTAPLINTVFPLTSSMVYTAQNPATAVPQANTVYSVPPKSSIASFLDPITQVVNQGTGIYNSISSIFRKPAVTSQPVQYVTSTPSTILPQQGQQIAPPTSSGNTTILTPQGYGGLSNIGQNINPSWLIIGAVVLIAVLMLGRK